MKFTVSRDAIFREVGHLKKVVTRSSTMPILDYFLFELSKGELSITANNLSLRATATIAVECNKNETGTIAVPSRLLTKALRVLPSQHLTFTTDSAFGIRIECETGTYEIRGESAGEYPKNTDLENTKNVSLPASVIACGFGKTSWASGNDNLRPILSGVLLQLGKEDIRFVSTDAHRLVVHKRTGIDCPHVDEMVISSETVKLLEGYMPGISVDVSIDFNEDHISFRFANVQVVSRLVSGRYPKYEEVIQKKQPNKLTAGRMTMIAAIKRVNVFSSKETKQMTLDIASGRAKVSSEDLDGNSKAKESLACSYAGNDLRIGFRCSFMLDALKVIKCDEVTLKMAEPNRAIIVAPTDQPEGEETFVLIMPVMLNN